MEDFPVLHNFIQTKPKTIQVIAIKKSIFEIRAEKLSDSSKEIFQQAILSGALPCGVFYIARHGDTKLM